MDRPFDVESRDSSFRPWRPQNSHAECRTDGDASFRCKTDPGSIPGGCNTQSVHLATSFFFQSGGWGVIDE